jgi:hypothetical protein
MSDSEWYILVDEDIEPRVVEFLEKEGIRADRVPDVLFQGADDEADVMPYARNHNAVLVTANWRDFTRFDPDRHYGCLIEFGQDESAMEITKAVLTAIEHYSNPDNLDGWDKLEYWLTQSRR